MDTTEKISKDTRRGIHSIDLWILILMVLFTIGSLLWFFHQNKSEDIVQVISAQMQEQQRSNDTPQRPVAPGILQDEKININTAGESDLQRLPRIGPARSADIIAYREENGAFEDIADIVEVSGIGEKTYELISPYVTTEDISRNRVLSSD